MAPSCAFREAPCHGSVGYPGGVRARTQILSDHPLTQRTETAILPGHAPIQDASCFSDGNAAARAPTSAMICCAERQGRELRPSGARHKE